VRFTPAGLCLIFLAATAPGGRLCSAGTLSGKHLVQLKVCFTGFVNWDFRNRRKLRSWKATALVLKRTLECWYPQAVSRPLVENGSPETFKKFLGSLPGEKDCDFSVMYLASHQSPSGEWDFSEQKTTRLNQLLEGTRIPKHRRRIVVLDTCFAAAVGREDPWQQRLAPISLFASGSSEETPEVNFCDPQPVDFAHRYPGAFAWLKDCLGKQWDGKLSFLGFIWVQSFLTEKNSPADLIGWIAFLRRCQSMAKQFRDHLGGKSSSQITLALKP
jgi:hypothetical protein